MNIFIIIGLAVLLPIALGTFLYGFAMGTSRPSKSPGEDGTKVNLFAFIIFVVFWEFIFVYALGAAIADKQDQ